MICVNPQIYEWWDKGLVALKCLGIFPTTRDHAKVSIQFCWMPRRHRDNHDPGREILPFLNCRYMTTSLEKYNPFARLPTEAGNSVAGKKILSGEKVDIHTTMTKAKKMKMMLDFQWHLITIRAVSRAVGPPEVPDGEWEPPTWCNDNQRQMIIDWLNTTEFLPPSQPGSPVAAHSTPKSTRSCTQHTAERDGSAAIS